MTTSKSTGKRNEKSSAAEKLKKIDDILNTTGKESGDEFVVVDVSRSQNGETKNRNDD